MSQDASVALTTLSSHTDDIRCQLREISYTLQRIEKNQEISMRTLATAVVTAGLCANTEIDKSSLTGLNTLVTDIVTHIDVVLSASEGGEQ